MKQRTPSADVSSWTPPESVTTKRGVRLEPEEVEVAQRRGREHAASRRRRRRRSPPVARASAGERGRGRQRRGERDQAVGDRGQLLGVVDERRPVQRDERVVARLDAELLPAPARARRVDVLEQRVDHRVPDEVHRRRDPLALEVRDRLLRVGEQDVAEVVGEHAVVLLRHRAVEAAEPRLDVRDGTPSFTAASAPASVELTSPATTQRSVSRSSSTRSTPTSAFAVCSACVPEPTPRNSSGARHPELAEEDVRHRVVVVLPRVQEHELQGGVERGQLPGRPAPTS